MQAFRRKFNSSNKKEVDKTSDDYIPTTREMWKFYLSFLKISWGSILFFNLYGIVNTLIAQRSPFVILNIATALEENDKEQIKLLILEFISSEILMTCFNFASNRFHSTLRSQMNSSIQKQIMEHLFSLDIKYFEDHKVSAISQVVANGSSFICSQLSYGQFMQQINNYIFRFGSIYFIYKQSQNLLITMAISGFIFSSINFYIGQKKKDLQKELDKGDEHKTFALDDILQNIQIIKSFGSEKKEIKQLESIIESNKSYELKSQKFGQIQQIMNSTTYSIQKVLIILQVSFGFFNFTSETVMLSRSFTQLFNEVFSIYSLCTTIIRQVFDPQQDYYESGKKSLGKVMKLLQEKPLINESAGSQGTIQLLKGDISFEKVSFKYPISKDSIAKYNQEKTRELKEKQELKETQIITKNNPEEEKLIREGDTSSADSETSPKDKLANQPIKEPKERENVINNVSFEIKQGQCVAFVGMSGSGKSTVVKLMERFYDATQGDILFDGKNVKDIGLSQLRRSIGLVQQEPSLFDNDIEYNITYGCLDDKYTQEELRLICDASGVSEFVFDENRFPEGLKTLVGSKGMKLSGGQKQRIAIARALMKKPSILILDEATSSLDAESEHIVQTYIDKLVGHRGLTIIVIAHRLSTVINSDKIFVMKNGQIQEEGTHQQLLEKDGVYKKLIHHQINRAERFQEDIISNQQINLDFIKFSNQ